jgi:hypothetical protein
MEWTAQSEISDRILDANRTMRPHLQLERGSRDAKLTGDALQFVNGRDKFTDDNVEYETLKAVLVDRFSKELPARYYYILLLEATQGKDESPIQFLDRCRALNAKTVTKSANPMEKHILREEAEFRLLTSFIYGMRGEAGHELRFRNPETIDQASSIATVVYNAKELGPRHRDHETLTVKVEERSFANKKGFRPTWCRDWKPQGLPVRRPPRQGNRSWDRVPTHGQVFLVQTAQPHSKVLR